MKNQQYKNFFKFIFFILFGLFLIGGLVYATNVFPTDENDWSDGEVIESDWANQLEYRIGANATTSKSTLTYQVNTLMATTSFPGLSVIGTITTGVWNGTAIGNTYGGTGINSSALTGIAQIVSGTWSASSTLSTAYGGTGWNSIQSNSVLLGNGAGRIATTTSGTDGYVLALSAGVPTWLATSTLSTITGTLAVAKGGTGQTSFGQGWLHSDGTTITSSTSPTVAYITATSTTATSTFSGDLRFDGELLPDGLTCANGEILKKTGANDWDCATDSTGTAVGTVSTSTTPVVGNLAYWTSTAYPSLLGTVATTSLTATSPLSLSQPISVIGSSASALTISVAGDWTGTIDGNNFAGGAIGAGELIYGGSAGSFSELALGTNGYVLALSGGIPAWTATTSIPLGGDVTGTLSSTVVGNDSHAHTGSTLSSIDIGDDTNLTCGTNCTLTGDDISVDDAFLLNTGDIGTGVYDFGGATSLEIPNGASPTVDATGEIAVDTTSDQLVYYGASEKKQIVPFYTTGFSYATTSWTGTTTIFMAPAMAAQTWNTAKCETSVGTLNVVVNDGTNNSNLLNASTTIGTFTLSSNNAFTSSETIRVDIGNPVSSPVKIACRFKYTYDAD